MASDQIEQLIYDVSGTADVDPNLARMWVRDAARRSFEVRHWSFLRRRQQIAIPAAISNLTTSATVSTAFGFSTITFSLPIADPSMVGLQIRFSSGATVVGATGPLYDIIGYNSPTSLEIAPQWMLSPLAASAFTIFLAYPTLPSDFSMFVSVVDTVWRRRLRTNVNREAIDRYDAARSRLGGPPAMLAPLDYSTIYSGRVYPALRVIGSGADVYASGAYTGQSDAVFVIQLTSTAVGGTATMQWSKNGGAFTAATTDAVVGNLLSDGVIALFDATASYTSGDVHVIRTSTVPTIGAPRVEIYPYQSSQMVLPYLYIARYPDITDDGVELPGIMARRDDVIREKALEFAATYPGTPDRPNNYEQINRRDYHAANWRQLVEELAREDNEILQSNVRSDPYMALPFAPLPWMSGTDLQSFDPPWIYPDYPAYT